MVIFVADILLHLISYGRIYLKDFWNILDIVIILFSIVAVLLDLFLNNEVLSSILKIRGIMRLVRIFILFRKLNAIRQKSERRKRMLSSRVSGVDLRTPQEIIIEYLVNIQERLDSNDKAFEQLNYCINMISSNRLYEADLSGDDDDDEEFKGRTRRASQRKPASNAEVLKWRK